MTIQLSIQNELDQASQAPLQQLCEDHFASRLLSRDETLWGKAARDEASKRLGWVDPFTTAEQVLEEATQLRDELRARGIDRIMLCGMGGSSLGPEVIAREAGVQLTVLDSTHPDVVRRALTGALTRTAVVVSSKSGGTIETRSHAETFLAAFRSAGLDPKAHVFYVTDPGSPLSGEAEQGYRVFLADPNVGGRFSALTAFGIVPTVLAGADMGRVLSEARAVHELLFADSPENPALRLAAAVAAALPERYVLLLSEGSEGVDQSWGLSDWIEQLVAESTGKEGVGVLPVALPGGAHELLTPPPHAIAIRLNAPAKDQTSDIALVAPLGAQLLLWQVATAALGRLMRINPFDQPDVEAAKVAARSALQHAAESLGDADAAHDDELIEQLQRAVSANGYVAIQAFVDRESPLGARAVRLRERLAAELGVPVALGWGPRYLHSTGQLHKGGPALGAFVQLVDDSATELPIGLEPAAGFGALMSAQARGDREVLEDRGRTVLRLAQ